MTNRYEDPADPTFAGPSDSYSYLTMAQSAPGLPQKDPADLFAFTTHSAWRFRIFSA